MATSDVIDYLRRHDKPFSWIPHARAETAQELAHALHVPGRRIAKSVAVSADGRVYLALLPAPLRVDEQRLAEVLDAKQVAVVPETTLAELFPDCDVGAEPPFGRLYDVPVVLDASLRNEPWLICRAGSHQDALELKSDDLVSLEQPVIASFAYEPSRELVSPWRMQV